MSRRLVILTELIAPYRVPLFNALARDPAIDLHVIFLSETDTSLRQWKIYSDEIDFSYEVLPFWRRRLGKYNILLNQNVSASLRDALPDVVLCGGYNYLASWQAMLWTGRNQLPFFLWCESTSHDLRRKRLLVETMKEKFLQNCDGFVVPGRASRDYLLGLGIPSHKLFDAPNAVDNALFASLAAAARCRQPRIRGELCLPERYFLFAGRLVRAKGTFDLLDAYAGLPPDLRAKIGLVFAGNGPLRAELEAVARSIYPGDVRFPGFVHRDQLASYYALADCLVLPTHTDTWGMVVNEAMACGLPLICSDIAGAAELVNGNGRLIPPRETHQLSLAMLEIASDASLRRGMAARSLDIIRAYSPHACAAGIAQAVTAGDLISVE
jgi:glycosyltransferase involved in cell wall biosynthesis